MARGKMTEWKEVELRMARVQKLAKSLDDQYRIPGTKIRFGMDNVVGLIPGIGDFATGAAGLWLIVEAYRLKAPWMLILRMLMNVLIDALLGVVPVLGDLFDLFWKSNRRNARLLEKHVEKRSPRPARLEE